MSRITIDVTPEQHQQVKTMAAIQGQSIKEFVLQRLFPEDEAEAQAWQELKGLLTTRIAQAERGELSNRSFEQVLADRLASQGEA